VNELIVRCQDLHRLKDCCFLFHARESSHEAMDIGGPMKRIFSDCFEEEGLLLGPSVLFWRVVREAAGLTLSSTERPISGQEVVKLTHYCGKAVITI